MSLLGLLTFAGCASSAAYTIPAAAVNTAIALGAAAGQRAAGGCYAVCTHGTSCNPKTGMCEKAAEAAAANQICHEEPGGEMRCIPFEITAERPVGAGSGSVSGVGVSPATGSVPPPPSEASPRGP